MNHVLSMRKTQTRRVIKDGEIALRSSHNMISAVVQHNKLKWCVGKTYAVQPGRGKRQIARIRIEQINSEYVTRISTADAFDEGFESRQSFLRTWQRIHGTDALSLRVWVIKFSVVSLSIPPVSIAYMPTISQNQNIETVSYAYQ